MTVPNISFSIVPIPRSPSSQQDIELNQSTLEQIWRYARIPFILPLFKDAAVAGLRMLAKKYVLSAPSRDVCIASKRWLIQNWSREPNNSYTQTFHQIDSRQNRLSAASYIRNDLPERIKEHARVLLIFQARSDSFCYDRHEWLVDLARAQDRLIHFVVFDYPGGGESTGTRESEQDLIDSGVAMVNWINRTLDVRDHKIHFYGRSMGGSVAYLVKAALARENRRIGDVLADRSPQSMTSVVRSRVGCLASGLQTFLKGVNFNALKAIESLPEDGSVHWCLYSKEDKVVLPEASLHLAARCEPKELTRMDKPGEIIDIHNVPILSGYYVDGVRISMQIFDQVLRAPRKSFLLCLSDNAP